jgi:hypothetical protein
MRRRKFLGAAYTAGLEHAGLGDTERAASCRQVSATNPAHVGARCSLAVLR